MKAILSNIEGTVHKKIETEDNLEEVGHFKYPGSLLPADGTIEKKWEPE